jgi:hypothetical protein
VSEFSESFHFRTSRRDALIARLKDAKQAGLVFPASGLWTAFVPFAQSPDYRSKGGPSREYAPFLSELTGQTVLHFLYAEDHGWTFALYDAGAEVGKYACWWDPEFSIESEIDLASLMNFASDADDLKHLLSPVSAHDARVSGPAQRFARCMGLGEVAWLSPDYVQSAPDPYVKRGAVRVGRKPATPGQVLRKPRFKSIVLPNDRPSARETLAVLQPLMAAWDPGYRPRSLASRLRGAPTDSRRIAVDADGRLSANGSWTVSFDKLSSDKATFLHIGVTAKGAVTVDGGRSRGRIVDGKPWLWGPLPPDWIDSTEVARILSGEWDDATLATMQLGPEEPQGGLAWYVTFRRFAEIRHFSVDALNGRCRRHE